MKSIAKKGCKVKSCEFCEYAKETDFCLRLRCKKNKELVSLDYLCEKFKRKKKYINDKK